MKSSEFKTVDFETTGFNPYKGDTIFAYVLCGEDMNSEVYRLDEDDDSLNMANEYRLSKFMDDTSQIKIAHNAKFEMGMYAMFNGGILPEGEWHDTLLMSQILKNLLQSHKLENLAEKYFKDEFPQMVKRWNFYDAQVKKHMTTQKRLFNNYPHRVDPEIFDPLKLEGIKPMGKRQPSYSYIPRKIMNGYQIADGERGMMLHMLMYPILKRKERMHEDYLNEMRLLRTKQKMEQIGMMLHENESNILIEELRESIKKINRRKKKIFGFDINIDSSDQLQKHLFNYVNEKKHEDLDQDWKIKDPVFDFVPVELTKSNMPSASKENLLKLREQHPKEEVFDLILQHRAYSKGITMIDSYIKLSGDNKIIHPNMKTNEARTGRQSMSNPNLQNVSKETSVNTVYGIPARRCFRPRPGYVFILGDYAGIEMRLIIAATKEKYLVDQLNKDIDYDVHSYNAKHIYGKEFTDLPSGRTKKDMRSDIKNATFGISYGANLLTFAHAIRRPVRDARVKYENYKKVCPGICGFTKDMIAQVKKTGFITTAFGRELQIERSKAYTASNYKIQGDAAGALKRGENNIDDYIQDVHNGDYDRLRMLVDVHDEVILEVHRSILVDVHWLMYDLNYCMTNIPEIIVPLATEWKVSTTTWQDAKDFKI